MAQKTFIVSGIRWDKDGEKIKLPRKLEVTITDEDVDNLNDIDEVEDFISDEISDMTGFCHFGWANTTEKK